MSQSLSSKIMYKFSSESCKIEDYNMIYNSEIDKWQYHDRRASRFVTVRNLNDFSSTLEEAELKDYLFNIKKNADSIEVFKKRISQQEADIQRLYKANEHFHEKYSHLREKYPEKFI